MFRMEKFVAGPDEARFRQLAFCPPVMEMNLGRVFTEEETQWYYRMMLATNQTEGPAGFWQVFRAEDDAFIGMCAVQENEEQDALEIEYMLLPEYWGRGYATQLVRMQMEKLDAACPGKRVIAITDPANRASIRVLEKNGFASGPAFKNEDGETAQVFER